MCPRFDRKNYASTGQMVVSAWMRLLRIPNLIFIAVCQILVYLKLLRPYVAHEDPTFNDIEFLGLVLTTLILAASAYLVNNILDRKIDANYPEYKIIPEVFSLRFCWILYMILIISGALPAFYLSSQGGQYASFIYYPIAVISLLVYSTSLKCTPILGNLFVALFTALFILVIPLAFYEDLVLLRQLDFVQWKEIMFVIFLMSSFSFITNFIRELVKDMEDMQADATEKCRSTAHYLGIEKTRFIVIIFWLLLLFYIGYSLSLIQFNLITILSAAVLVIIAVLISYYLFKPTEHKLLKKLSKLLKLLMVTGLVYCLFYNL